MPDNARVIRAISSLATGREGRDSLPDPVPRGTPFHPTVTSGLLNTVIVLSFSWMRWTRLAVVVPTLLLVIGCEAGPSPTTTGETTTTSQTTTTTFPEFPIEDVRSKFIEGELVAVFGFSLDEHPTLSGLPTDRDDAPPSGGSGSFDRQATDLVATGIATSWDGGPPWERLELGGPDEFGNAQFDAYLPQDRVGFLGGTEIVTDLVASMTNERVEVLAMEVAQHLADLEGLEVVPIMQREYLGRELTFDLVGGIDEATAGWRIHVVMEEDGNLFRVVDVERTLFCWFAVDESGVCIDDPRS